MIFPDERVLEVCRLGPVKASELLDKARAGDLQALADWAVYSVHKHFINLKASPAEARHHTRTMISNIILTPKVSL